VVKVVGNVQVDRLFSHAVNLTGASVQFFVAALCDVSGSIIEYPII
jgi:hypothetical protein